MKITKTNTVLLIALMMGLAATASAQKDKPTLSPDEAKAQQAYALGVQAYIWGYPMVVMQRSRNAMTNPLLMDACSADITLSFPNLFVLPSSC